jgi:hypothetical protein
VFTTFNTKAEMEDVLDEVVSSEDLKVCENYVFFEIVNISTLEKTAIRLCD